jgi:cob(I)alamin adenosyltransferase
MKIYTKTGDGGETGLWGGGRTSKDDIRIHAYGTVDECNSILGIVRTFSIGSDLDGILAQIQNDLFIVGGDLATPGIESAAITRVSPEMAAFLEGCIDKLESSLPPLKQFILPGGCPAAAYLHLARTVCRRAERYVTSLVRVDATHSPALIYLNRLSDFLFVAARTANRQVGIPDVPRHDSSKSG